MSREPSPNSRSESSSAESPNQTLMATKDYRHHDQREDGEFRLLGGNAANSLNCVSALGVQLKRSSTVRRASTKRDAAKSIDDAELDGRFELRQQSVEQQRLRRSLDASYRRSLESISEHKNSYSSFSLVLDNGRDYFGTSLESPSSDSNDYAILSDHYATIPHQNSQSDEQQQLENDRRIHDETETDQKTFSSVSSNYLSWIESVSDFGGHHHRSAVTSTNAIGNENKSSAMVDVDTKVGEWNNFWLNYNSPQYRYISSAYLCTSNVDDQRTVDDVSECKSTCSTQKISSTEQIIVGLDEINEAVQCAQRIAEILQRAIARNYGDDVDQSRNDSYYSQRTSLITEDLRRDNKYLPYQESQEQGRRGSSLRKFLPSAVGGGVTTTTSTSAPTTTAPTATSTSAQSGTSCINVLLNTTGMADILKRVISSSKRRDDTQEEYHGRTMTTTTTAASPRSSFSNWSK